MKTKLVAIEIPAKYKWVAIDEDGERYVHVKKPVIKNLIGCGSYWSSENVMRIGSDLPAKNWENSLKRLEEVEYVG